MTSKKTKIEEPKGKFLPLFEKILFIFCIVVIVLRATSSEPPTVRSSPIQAIINDTVFSLCVSGTLISAFFTWLLARVFSNRASFKISSVCAGFVLLIAGIIVAAFFAANKRSAITFGITLIAPILMAAMLAQLLDSQVKIKILLITLAALGIYTSFLAADQYFIENNLLIQQYQDDPDTMLEQLGIEKNSFNHILLEHRIYSKDVRTAFTTGNSAGSFAILTFFAAVAIAAEFFKKHKLYPTLTGNRGLLVLVLAFIAFGLFLTHSKGAIAALLFSAGICAILLRSKRPKLSKNIVLACCFAVIIVFACVAAWYGDKFGKLPGGNSMLVRWQYWNASVKMFLGHPLTGVGGGNFAFYYPQYKTASAPETVSDPHCFILSILTQYGPAALLGLLIIIIAPLWRNSLEDNINLETASSSSFKNTAILGVIVSTVLLIILRPLILPQGITETIEEKLYVWFTLYFAPAAAFAVGVAIFAKALQTSRNEYDLQSTHLTSIVLFCGILGFLIHNIIDFAIFEPGILTAFFASLACLAAMNSKSQEQKSAAASPLWLKTASVLCALAAGYGYFNYAFIPVAKSSYEISKARSAMVLGEVQLAHYYLDTATNDDPLGPEAPYLNGQLYLNEFYRSDGQKEQLFDNAERTLFVAAQRNPQDYKIFNALAELYSLYSRLVPEQREVMLNRALDSASIAVKLYPGDAELHLLLAQTAEELGQNDLALKHYRIAVQIEDDFRTQFKLMYPGRKVLSRLNEDKYFFATQRIKELEQLPAKP
jgi:hypothetical protein